MKFPTPTEVDFGNDRGYEELCLKIQENMRKRLFSYFPQSTEFRFLSRLKADLYASGWNLKENASGNPREPETEWIFSPAVSAQKYYDK